MIKLLKKFLAKHEIKRIHEILFFSGIILIVILIKSLINYGDYSLLKSTPYRNDGFYYNCLDYVVKNKPTLEEYKKSEWKDYFTKININNEETYIACFENIIYVDYPSFFKKKYIKEYPLQQAFAKNLITYNEFETYFNNNVLTDITNYKINDLLIFNK